MKVRRVLKQISVFALIGIILATDITPAYAATSVASVNETQTASSNEASSCDVYAQLDSNFIVTIPKKITLDGLTKKGSYTVNVNGDIAGYEKINVMPDESFALSSIGLSDVTALINQDKVSWKYNDFSTTGNGVIDANKISAGTWIGTFNFNINLQNSLISVEAKDKNGNDLNANASEITGTKKDTLLNSLESTGMISSKDDVDILIEVESDEFDGMAATTFDVSEIASTGDKVTILHFDETKQEWEYISTETVDSQGKISSNFFSYSPVAFIKYTSEGEEQKLYFWKKYNAQVSQTKYEPVLNSYTTTLKRTYDSYAAAHHYDYYYTFSTSTGQFTKSNRDINWSSFTKSMYFYRNGNYYKFDSYTEPRSTTPRPQVHTETGYQVLKINTVYTYKQGTTYITTISSTNENAYPTSGEQGGYWYVKQ